MKKFIKETEQNKNASESKIEKILKNFTLKSPRKGIKNVLSEEELKETLNLK